MISTIIRLYKDLPDERKQKISYYVFPLKFIVKSLLDLRFDVYEISGEKKIVYITSDEPDPGFIDCFYPGASMTSIGKTSAWSLRKIARQHTMVIIDMPRYLGRFFTDGILTDSWVKMVCDLSTPVEDLLKTRIGKEIKKAQKFQYEFTTEQADLQFFYEKMYLPYIKRRYANPMIEKFISMQNDLKNKGELCFIKKGDERIAGALFNQTGDTYYLLNLGLMNDRYLKEGAITAMYYYGMQRASERKVRFIDLGLTRPFLSDGVFSYKRKWGARVVRDQRSNRILYLKNLVKNQQIVLDGAKLKVLVLAGEDTLASAQAADIGLETKVIEDLPDNRVFLPDITWIGFLMGLMMFILFLFDSILDFLEICPFC